MDPRDANFHEPVLITITAPTAAGKSFLFNYIRDVAKLPCLISTTTRPRREGEVEGVDYFFIDEAESKRLEEANQFAELVTYRGVRYGVTNTEFFNKLSSGLAFLIVEPTGIDHYVKPAIDAGARHFKVFVHTDITTRLDRFKVRALADLDAAVQTGRLSSISKIATTYLDRLEALLTVESDWFQCAQWDLVVNGITSPQDNLANILNSVRMKLIRAR